MGAPKKVPLILGNPQILSGEIRAFKLLGLGMHAIFCPGRLAMFGKGEVEGVGMCSGVFANFMAFAALFLLQIASNFAVGAWNSSICSVCRLDRRSAALYNIPRFPFSAQRRDKQFPFS